MTDSNVHAVRSFNRFYTRQIGLLSESHLDSPFSLTEVRVLYEIAHRELPTATEIGRDLGLDAGYLSRILLRFQKRGLIARKRSPEDGRQSHLLLTARGRQTFAPLERGATKVIASMLDRLAAPDQHRLVQSMRLIQQLLGAQSQAAVTLRPPRPGDMGWVIQRHGEIYAQEYGWDERFEALVAEICAKFVQHFDPERERCWIAERDGVPVGSVFLVRQSDEVAKLRLLLVEPSARGIGVGQRLVAECIRFAREKGYRTITLWTQEILLAARHIYSKAGFQVVHRERQAVFGPELTAETWELTL